MENDERINNITCFVSMQEELIKLYCIVFNAKETFSGEYLKEKVGRILSGIPIIIHPSLYTLYLEVSDAVKEKHGK